MNILITGAGGFVGKNLVCALENIWDGKDRTHPELEIGKIFRCTRQTTEAELKEYCSNAEYNQVTPSVFRIMERLLMSNSVASCRKRSTKNSDMKNTA